MGIENTQWNDPERYDNKHNFDLLKKQLAPWGYTDESWDDDELPKLTLLGDAYHEHDINLFIGYADTSKNEAIHGQEAMFCLSMDSNFLNSLNDDPNQCFYFGSDINQVMKVAKQIAPAQETYALLLQRKYSIIHTGGGCMAWAKSFGRHYVMVTDDGGSSASFIAINEAGESVHTDEVVCIGCYDSGSPLYDDPSDAGDALSWARLGHREDLEEALKRAEVVCATQDIITSKR